MLPGSVGLWGGYGTRLDRQKSAKHYLSFCHPCLWNNLSFLHWCASPSVVLINWSNSVECIITENAPASQIIVILQPTCMGSEALIRRALFLQCCVLSQPLESIRHVWHVGTLLWVWRTKVESSDLSNFSILVQNILLGLFWFPSLLQRSRVRIGFRKEMVQGSGRIGSRAWGDLSLLPRFVLAVRGWLWAKQIPCLQSGHSETPGVSTCSGWDSSLENSFCLGVCLLDCPSWTK